MRVAIYLTVDVDPRDWRLRAGDPHMNTTEIRKAVRTQVGKILGLALNDGADPLLTLVRCNGYRYPTTD